ncbi:MAG: hypothetical protein ACRDNZ_19555 [Streptosporangiaceae bacterium]
MTRRRLGVIVQSCHDLPASWNRDCFHHSRTRWRWRPGRRPAATRLVETPAVCEPDLRRLREHPARAEPDRHLRAHQSAAGFAAGGLTICAGLTAQAAADGQQWTGLIITSGGRNLRASACLSTNGASR